MMSSKGKKKSIDLAGPELVIGVVAPLGSNISLVVKVLIEELAKVNYQTVEVRVSTLLHQIVDYACLADRDRMTEAERIAAHMTAGTSLRSSTGRGDIMALLAVGRIRDIRSECNAGNSCEKAEEPLRRTAYILRSLKHPDEVRRLREVYGKSFFLVSAYSPREARVEFLSQALAKSANDSDSARYRSNAEELINRDEDEEGNKLGQNVSDAFPLADLFVDSRQKENLSASISRFVEAFFGYPYHTPTIDEFGMYFAKAAALRSADLSRQVGAVITTRDGEVISVGCNDIPKCGGGLYWAGDPNDARDFVVGEEMGTVSRKNMLSEIVHKLKKAKYLSEDHGTKKVEEIVAELTTGNDKEVLADAQLMNVIEYGRSVHAEMAALSDAAKRGNPVNGATLYTTTFPCHLCARHIVASGIERVVYIEPYPKSQTKKMYSDSVVVDPESKVEKRVHFVPFVGISPVSFQWLFESRTKRKDSSTGEIVDWEKATARPDVYQFLASYLLIEEHLVGKVLPEILKESNMDTVT